MQVLQQVFPSGEEPIDIVFCMIGDNLTMSPIEVNGGFSPSKKRDMRIKVLNLFLNKEILIYGKQLNLCISRSIL